MIICQPRSLGKISETRDEPSASLRDRSGQPSYFTILHQKYLGFRLIPTMAIGEIARST